MDADTAWQKFGESVKKADNQTSVEDKLDVILAQQQEVLTDTSRVADLVPLITGDKAQEDTLEETGEITPEQATDEIGQEVSEDLQGSEEDNPFAFLDEEDTVADTEDDFEMTDEDTDIVEGDGDDVSEEDVADEDMPSDEASDEDTEEVDGEAPEEEQVTDEEQQADEEDTADDEDVMSFEDIFDEEEDVKKSSEPELPRTKTIKSLSTPMPMKVVTKVQKPTPDFAYGRAQSPDEINDMLSKAMGLPDDDIEIGFGVDHAKATEKDWAFLRMLSKSNQLF